MGGGVRTSRTLENYDFQDTVYLYIFADLWLRLEPGFQFLGPAGQNRFHFRALRGRYLVSTVLYTPKIFARGSSYCTKFGSGGYGGGGRTSCTLENYDFQDTVYLYKLLIFGSDWSPDFNFWALRGRIVSISGPCGADTWFPRCCTRRKFLLAKVRTARSLVRVAIGGVRTSYTVKVRSL